MSGEVVPFISDRALKADLKQYLYSRFDYHMDQVGTKGVTRELAIAAFFAEMNDLDDEPDGAA